MIRENQKLLNQINVISDALILFLSLPFAFWFRFYVLPSGIITVPLQKYWALNLSLMLGHLLCYAAFGLYSSLRRTALSKELSLLCFSSVLNLSASLSFLFLFWEMHYSRMTLAIYFVLSLGVVSCKRILLRLYLRRLRRAGYNQKHVVLLGTGVTARSYLKAIQTQRSLGYHAVGYVARQAAPDMDSLSYLGSFDRLESILERLQPDEVVAALDAEDLPLTPGIINLCEKLGLKLSLIPFYAEHMSSTPQFDSIGNIPLLNIRRVPLDNWGNAVCKRLVDIAGSLALILLTSPIMLVCAVGVRLSSPGPVIFRQQRVGRNKKKFSMYKFRSMRVNSQQTTRWSTDRDERKTPFGAFLRKYSLDELPQFFNVLKGDMSLVGPRPELPHFVEQFKDEIPLYMVKHQVRPGITGWAQVNDLRGDTSIRARVEHDIYYIENWSLWLDIKILFVTIFKGKFKNSEQLR